MLYIKNELLRIINYKLVKKVIAKSFYSLGLGATDWKFYKINQNLVQLDFPLLLPSLESLKTV